MNIFDKLVNEALNNKPELNFSRTTVEKEILHHDILKILNENGFLTQLTFIGVFLVLRPETTGAYFALIFLTLAALFFASLDIINKKYISTESTLSMMFYSALITTTLGGVNVISELKSLGYIQFVLLFLLGSGANLLLYCLLQAFKYVDASFLSPFRYLELVFSIIFGYVLFNEVVSLNVLVGAVVIIFSVIFVTYNERYKNT